jgi:hypothetical protein
MNRGTQKPAANGRNRPATSEGNGLVTDERARGTSRERATVAAMILIGAALPVVANLPVFQNVVWVFWLAALVLILIALALVVGISRRERRRSGES